MANPKGDPATPFQVDSVTATEGVSPTITTAPRIHTSYGDGYGDGYG